MAYRASLSNKPVSDLLRFLGPPLEAPPSTSRPPEEFGHEVQAGGDDHGSGIQPARASPEEQKRFVAHFCSSLAELEAFRYAAPVPLNETCSHQKKTLTRM